MKHNRGKVNEVTAVRPRKTVRRQGQPLASQVSQTLTDPQQRIRELQMRLVELEAQNEDLRRVRDEAITALRESETHAQHLLETSPDFICTFGMDRKFTDVNNSGARNFGYASKHDFIGRDILDFTAKRSYGDALRIMQANIKHGVVHNEPIYILNQRGEEVPVEICGRLVKNTAGQPTGFVVTLRDVTDRKRAENKLNEFRESLQSIYTASPAAIITLDLAGHVTKFSPAAERIFGWREAEVLGRFNPIIPDYKHEEFWRDFRHALQDTNSVREVIRRKKDGTPIHLALTTAPLLDAQKNPCGAVGIFLDITDSKKNEEALRASEMTLRTLINGYPESLFLIDRKGTILAANEIMAQRLGHSVAEIIGTCIDDLMPAEVAAPRRVRVEEVIRTGRSLQFEDTRGGRHFSCHMHPVLNDIGQVFRVAILAQDITERKQAEEALRNLTGQLLQSQDEERRRIARELHDTTAQQLVGMLFSLNSLKKHLAEPAHPVLAESMSVTKHCIDEIRTLSFLLHPPQLDHFGLAGAIQDFIAEFARRSGLEIKLELAQVKKRLDPEYELALMRILQEALWNAYRHSGSRTATVRLFKSDGEIHLEIADAGQGIPAPKSGRKGTAKVQTGVGIHGMHERLRYLGGRLDIQTGPTGTTLRAIVPLAGNAAKVKPKRNLKSR
jgi:PAS domain S-box-containing protein